MKTLKYVEIQNNACFTTSIVISEQCDGRSHESTIKLIRKHIGFFERLGKVNFESSLNTKIESDFKSDSKRQKGGRETLYCHLNEDQATFLITLFRNTPTVLEFKCRLVEEFRNALDEINRLYANPPRQGIIQEKRDAHGLMMNALIELRSEQGKETNPAHFMCENKLCNGVVTGNYAKADESGLSNADIELLAQVRKRNEAFLMSGLDYQERKKRLIAFAMKHRTKLIG